MRIRFAFSGLSRSVADATFFSSLSFFPQPVRSERYSSRRVSFVRKLVPSATPLRFALHRRYGSDWAEVSKSQEGKRDEEELDSFDSIGEVPDSEAVVRMPEEVEETPEPLSLNRTSPFGSMSRSESGGTIPSLSISNSQSLSTPSTAATSPVASRRPSLSEYKSLEQEVAEENSKLEIEVPVYPTSSPRPPTITFAATQAQAQSQARESNITLKSATQTVPRSQASKATVEPKSREISPRFTRIKSIPWFRKSNEKEVDASAGEEGLKKKRSTTLRFFDTIGKKSKALVNSNNASPSLNTQSVVDPSSTKPLQRRRSMTEASSTPLEEGIGLSRHSVSNFLEAKGTQTLGRLNSRRRQNKSPRPSTAGAAPEHAFTCYYSEDGTSCVKQGQVSTST